MNILINKNKFSWKLSICSVCGKVWSHFWCMKRSFCSKKCGGIARRKRIIKICEGCGREHERKNFEKDTRFCGLWCSNHYGRNGINNTSYIERIKAKCPICGEKYKTLPTTSNRHHKKYCSKECSLKGISKTLKGRIFSQEHKAKLKEKRKFQISPKFDTSIEIKIQEHLKKLGFVFYTHQYIKEIKHGYQCDILIPSLKLIIECDGDYFHSYPMGTEIDHIRTKELLVGGFNVLRLWEHEIKTMNEEDLKKRIFEVIII